MLVAGISGITLEVPSTLICCHQWKRKHIFMCFFFPPTLIQSKTVVFAIENKVSRKRSPGRKFLKTDVQLASYSLVWAVKTEVFGKLIPSYLILAWESQNEQSCMADNFVICCSVRFQLWMLARSLMFSFLFAQFR